MPVNSGLVGADVRELRSLGEAVPAARIHPLRKLKRFQTVGMNLNKVVIFQEF
jgi:hypothetical protein